MAAADRAYLGRRPLPAAAGRRRRGRAGRRPAGRPPRRPGGRPRPGRRRAGHRRGRPGHLRHARRSAEPVAGLRRSTEPTARPGRSPRARRPGRPARPGRRPTWARSTAAQLVDPAFVARLAAVTGVAVTLLDGAAAPRGSPTRTESGGVRDAVLAAAAGVDGERVTETADGRYVRRVGPSAGQPLPLVLSVPGERPPGLYAALVGGGRAGRRCSRCWPPGGWPGPPPARWPSWPARSTGWPTAT